MNLKINKQTYLNAIKVKTVNNKQTPDIVFKIIPRISISYM